MSVTTTESTIGNEEQTVDMQELLIQVSLNKKLIFLAKFGTSQPHQEYQPAIIRSPNWIVFDRLLPLF